jgi:glycosyltransferase involved in cell wall biosynthesis
MIKNMKISCIIPTCDRNDFLKETIASVLSQTIQPFEIMVINNGGGEVVLPDDLLTKVKIFNIMYYAGVAQARNFGAAIAQGDYLVFIDDDDLWNKDYISNVSQAINSGAVCIVSRLDKMVDGKVSDYKNVNGKLDVNNILVRNPGITGSNLAINKDLFLKIGGFDPKLPPSEDKSLVLELLIKGYLVVALPDNQAIIREHQGVRLTGNRKLVEGIFQFTRKYQKLMSYDVYLYNLKKMYRYQTLDKDIKAFFPFFVVSLMLFVVKKIKFIK